MRYLQQGVALIQVLLFTLLLTVILSAVSLRAQQEVKAAQQVLDRADAMLALHSAENEMLFALSTSHRVIDPKSILPIAQQWNFMDVPFTVGTVTYRLKDQATLLSLTAPQSLQPLLEKLTGDTEQARQIIASIEDWQDPDDDRRFGGAEQPQYGAGIRVRNGPIQYLYELQWIHGVTPSLYEQLQQHLTLFPKRFNNLYGMEDSLLSAYVDPVQAEQILAERRSGKLTPERFSTLSGIEQNEFISFVTGESLRVHFTVQINDVKLSRAFTVTLTPTSEQPWQFWDYFKYKYD